VRIKAAGSYPFVALTNLTMTITMNATMQNGMNIASESTKAATRRSQNPAKLAGDSAGATSACCDFSMLVDERITNSVNSSLISPGKRGNRTSQVMVRNLSGNPTNQELARRNFPQPDFGTMTPESVLEGMIFRVAVICRADFRT